MTSPDAPQLGRHRGSKTLVSSAATVITCSLVLIIVGRVTTVRDIDTNIDTGARWPWFVLSITLFVGAIAMAVCTLAFAAALLTRSGQRAAVAWWAAAVLSVVVAFVIAAVTA